MRKRITKDQLYKKVDILTEENQRYVLGVLESLNFAQLVSDMGRQEPSETAHPGMKHHGDQMGPVPV
jgi:hypothetical protein